MKVMKTIKRTLRFILSIILVWSVLNTARPFWDRYWFELQLRAATIYGTKNSIERVGAFLNVVMRNEGYDFDAEDFVIEKDENNNCFISIEYTDEISFFGVTLTEIDFVVEASASEVEEYK